jgi:hypothetical protein
VNAPDDSGLERVWIAFYEHESANLPMVEHGELMMREFSFTLRVFAKEREALTWLPYGYT